MPIRNCLLNSFHLALIAHKKFSSPNSYSNYYFCNRFDTKYNQKMQVLWKVTMHYNFLNQTYIHWICWSTEKEIIHTIDTAFNLPFIPKNLFICYQHKVVNPSFVRKLGYSDNQWDNCIVLIALIEIQWFVL